MNQIDQPIRQVQRRLLVGQFFNYFCWTLLAGLSIAFLGLLIPKLFYVATLQNPVQLSQWNYGWLLGGIILALLSAGILTFSRIQPKLAVATEIDHRFKLKERLSSAICLRPEDLNSPVGQALLQDAIAKAETIDIRDQFQFQPRRTALLPLFPAVLMCGLTFLPNASEPEFVAEADVEKVDRKQIEMMIEEAKKRKEQRQQEDATGLKDANPNLKSLSKQFDALLEDQNLDKKTTLVKLNDIKQQIEEKKRGLEAAKELKENLNRLKDAAKGPAKELADALGKGDLNDAQKAIKELADKLREGKLNEVEQKKLAADMQNMAEELKKMAQQKREEIQKLQEELEKAIEKGDLDKAAELQEKLDQAEQQQKLAEKMEQMAEKLKQCADCMKDGNAGRSKQGQQGQNKAGGEGEQGGQAQQDAADALDEIAQQLGQMQGDLEDLMDLEDLEKLAGDCQNCIGGNCQGDDPKWVDWAQGGGVGAGKRAIEEDETGGFRARVRGKLQKGETIVTGTADGDNIAGKSVSEARELVQRAMSRDHDPLDNQRLPRAQREHAQQYFEALRKTE